MSKRQKIREMRRKKAQRQRMAFIGIVVGVVLIFAALVIYQNNRPVEVVAITPEPRPNANFNAMGDPNAPVRVEEFSDFQCPYCRMFYEKYEAFFVENYVKTGKVYFLYRSMGNFLSDNINRAYGTNNQESIMAAQAAYCAGDQGLFWEYHDTLFANQTGEGVGDYEKKNLLVMAENLGMDVAAFEDCLDSEKYKTLAEQDATDGAAFGITGTPSFVVFWTVNGETRTTVVVGADGEGLQSAIEQALAEVSAAE